ncbi:MAG: hypothetical protein K2X87_19230 [Gemmataceae bacterium]|nr:hypothetical protein [Gemmataceae bacterium]
MANIRYWDPEIVVELGNEDYGDPAYVGTPEELKAFARQVWDAARATEVYSRWLDESTCEDAGDRQKYETFDEWWSDQQEAKER